MGYNEADTRAKLINPKLHEAGWSEDLIRREITAGTVEIINGKTIRKKFRKKVFLHFAFCTLHFAFNCSKSTRF